MKTEECTKRETADLEVPYKTRLKIGATLVFADLVSHVNFRGYPEEARKGYLAAREKEICDAIKGPPGEIEKLCSRATPLVEALTDPKYQETNDRLMSELRKAKEEAGLPTTVEEQYR